MRISFWGSSEFSLAILKALNKLSDKKKLEISYVVTQPAKPFGRKRELKSNPVESYCKETGIKVYTPEKLKEITFDEVDVSFVAAYGKIIPKTVLDTAKYAFLNFHGSILPKYRGATPIQMTVLNQDKVAGFTVIKMDEGMDTGDMLYKEFFNIDSSTTSGDLFTRMSDRCYEFVEGLGEKLLLNPEMWVLEKQDDEKASLCYVNDFTKEKMQVVYEDGRDLAHGKVMAANPEPLAWIFIGGKKINLIRSQLLERDDVKLDVEKSGELKLVSDENNKHLYLLLKDRSLEILELQPEGKKVMDGRSFINGYLR